MKQMFTLLLTAMLTVLAGDVCAQMPSQAFRAFLKQPAKFPRARLTELSEKQLTQLTNRVLRETERINLRNQQERLRQAHVFEVSRPAVFRVISKQSSGYHSLSGTLFQTTYKGQKEIFGVIPMHVLQDRGHLPGMIGKEFSAALQTEEGFKVLPAQVVQLSSSKTGDVALVKFRPEDETLLSPLSLSNANFTQFPKPVYAQGFARSILTQSSFPLVGTTSTGELVAQLPAAYEGARIGFCGSPVLTRQATLAGIHVGSRYNVEDPQQAAAFFKAFALPNPTKTTTDVGFITPVSFLKQLVHAYHQPTLKPLVVELAGQPTTHLAVDEYIASIELLDAQLNVLWNQETRLKTTLSAAQKAVQSFPQAAFVRLQIGKTRWIHDDKGWFVQDDDNYLIVLKPISHS